MSVKVAFYTLGCKLNFAETSSLAARFEQRGYERNLQMEGNDIIVINTCSVTSFAEKKGRNILAKARKINPNAVIIVLGCYAQLRAREIHNLHKADLILGNEEKLHIFDYLDSKGSRKILRQPYKEIRTTDVVYSSDDRTRTFLKVQDGCSFFCAYCTIPMARGLSRSSNIASVVASVKEIVASGSKEIILTGVNIGDFGRQHNENFAQLLRAIIQVEGLERVRIGSIEPNLLTDEIIELVTAHNVLMPHFHIPLQCGSDLLLKKMKRRYTTNLYARRVDTIKKHIPEACIAADVIVGVPGETQELHEEAKAFIQSMDISMLHVFTYSERQGTLAAQMTEQVHNKDRQIRSQEMHKLSEQLKTVFIKKQIGKKRSVLFEKEIKNGFIYGFTDNYIRVKKTNNENLINKIKNVELVSLGDDGNVNTK